MNKDERIIVDLLMKRDLQVKAFTKEKKAISKTPDLRVLKDDKLAFFCEVKTIEHDTWLEKIIMNAPPLTIVGGGGNDPRFNRIEGKIHEASLQFAAVNPNSEYPNVLAFVNHDDLCGIRDLESVLTGQFFAEGGKLFPIYMKYSEGRIKEEKYQIHLYIWSDAFKGNFYRFNIGNHKHLFSLCNYFGADPNSIREIREIHRERNRSS
jgi:hypothetical protein